jgi:hypothetical protein
VRWHFRLTLSLRDVEGLMAERGIEDSREAIRCLVIKLGPLVAAKLRRDRGLLGRRNVRSRGSPDGPGVGKFATDAARAPVEASL